MLYKCLPFLLLLVFLGNGCQSTPINYQLTQTERTEVQETYTVSFDNCSGLFAKSYTYRYPYTGKSVGVENLQPNGGEPFKSIRKDIWRMYGQPVEKIKLEVPPATKREFTFIVTKIEYRGVVSGEIIDENKIYPRQDAVYFYPLTQSILVDSYQDIPCSTSSEN